MEHNSAFFERIRDIVNDCIKPLRDDIAVLCSELESETPSNSGSRPRKPRVSGTVKEVNPWVQALVHVRDALAGEKVEGTIPVFFAKELKEHHSYDEIKSMSNEEILAKYRLFATADKLANIRNTTKRKPKSRGGYHATRKRSYKSH
jgi:hypothetical protein